MSHSTEYRLPTTVLIQIVSIWVLSDIGYYLFVWLLGAGSNYSTNPFIMAAYYLVWVVVALIVFSPLYQHWHAIRVDASMLQMLLVAAASVACYLVYVFPLFPAIHWTSLWKPPVELVSATGWYFLPKSIEIALQQLLVLAMVLALAARKFAVRDIAQWSATLFGSIHLLLIIGGSFAYTVFFTLCASVAGYIFPYLLLRVRNGFIYSYSLHWAFYAIVIVLVRVLYVH